MARKRYKKPKKKTEKYTKVLYVKNRQTGTRKSIKADRAREAYPPGKRRSKKGKVYYEYRRNRTDTGKNLL